MSIPTRHSRTPFRPWWARAIVRIYFFVLVLLLFSAVFLWKSGELLVHSDSFGHVRWAVVLAGEEAGMERSQAALALFREGRFDSLILSGPRVFRTHHESEFSAELLVSLGFPRDRIFQLPHDENSTQGEAEVILKQARLLGLDTLLVITSNYHSARAARIFDRLAAGVPKVKVYAMDDPVFDPKAWWSSRKGRIVWLLEWAKTLNTAWELAHRKPPDASGIMLLEPNPRIPEGSRASVPLPIDSVPGVATPDSLKTKDTTPTRSWENGRM